ncbi:endonuclease V [Alkalilimnicola ehrlichii]|nr:endonuclease V [Alkalilimnicola ehrlichii]
MESLHDWTDDPAQAVAIQKRLREALRIAPLVGEVRYLAAVDTGFTDGGSTARAAVVLYRWPELEPIEQHVAFAPVRFPYVPGLLSFRELPVVLDALACLSLKPDLILCDGQGIAHPRRLGIATHLGLVVDIPTIGVGKSRLTGRHQEPGPEKGAWEPLWDGDERIGTVLRTRTGVKPLYISPGHRVDHQQAVDWTLATIGRYRLPEPIRAADRLASNRGRKPNT